jgi:hypothetical protein
MPLSDFGSSNGFVDVTVGAIEVSAPTEFWPPVPISQQT